MVLFFPRERNLPWFKAESKDNYLLALILICAIKQKLWTLKKIERCFHRWGPIKPWNILSIKAISWIKNRADVNGQGGTNIFSQVGGGFQKRQNWGLYVFSKSNAKLTKTRNDKATKTRGCSGPGQAACTCPRSAVTGRPRHPALSSKVSKGSSPWPNTRLLQEPEAERKNRHAPSPTSDSK